MSQTEKPFEEETEDLEQSGSEESSEEEEVDDESEDIEISATLLEAEKEFLSELAKRASDLEVSKSISMEGSKKRNVRIGAKLIADRCLPPDFVKSATQDELAEAVLKVTHIRLDRLGLTRMENLEVYDRCTNLYLHHNAIEEIDCLEYLPSLRFLALSHNRIKTVHGLSSLTGLLFLDLSHNAIARVDWSEVPQSVEVLCLAQGNPCPAYSTTTVLRALPHVRRIDGVRVSTADRQSAGLEATQTGSSSDEEGEEGSGSSEGEGSEGEEEGLYEIDTILTACSLMGTTAAAQHKQYDTLEARLMAAEEGEGEDGDDESESESDSDSESEVAAAQGRGGGSSSSTMFDRVRAKVMTSESVRRAGRRVEELLSDVSRGREDAREEGRVALEELASEHTERTLSLLTDFDGVNDALAARQADILKRSRDRRTEMEELYARKHKAEQVRASKLGLKLLPTAAPPTADD